MSSFTEIKYCIISDKSNCETSCFNKRKLHKTTFTLKLNNSSYNGVLDYIDSIDILLNELNNDSHFDLPYSVVCLLYL